MPRVFANGRELQVPHDWRGRVNVNELREMIGLRRGRELILRRNSGENMVLPRHGRFALDPYADLVEVGAAKRGDDECHSTH